jgi:hypothetical protein
MPNNGAGAAASAPQQDSAVPGAAGEAGLQIIESGANYTAATLGQIATVTAPMAAKDSSAEGVKALPQLAAPKDLDACLAAVRMVHPGIVRRVDFARFDGQPAIVLLIEAGTDRVAVAVGPRCGTAGSDELAVRHL